MEIYQLKTFIEVARIENLTAAAINLNLSQPAVTAHIKALEKEVGFILFYRTPKGMKITEKGLLLLADVKKIVESMENLDLKYREISSNSVDIIRIGLNSEEEILRVNEIVNIISKEKKSLELHFIKTRSEDFIADIDNLKIDCGFYYGKIADSRIEQINLSTIKMAIVYPNNWDINSDNLSLNAFKNRQWIWATKGCPFYKESMNYFEHKLFSPEKILYVDDEVLIGELVSKGIGCSLLAEPLAMKFVKEKKLKIWREIDMNTTLSFGFLKETKKISIVKEICVILNKIWEE